MFTLEQCKEKLSKRFGNDIEVKIQDDKLYLRAFTEDKTSWVFLSSITSAFRELGLEVISESCGVSAYLFETKIKEDYKMRKTERWVLYIIGYADQDRAEYIADVSTHNSREEAVAEKRRVFGEGGIWSECDVYAKICKENEI